MAINIEYKSSSLKKPLMHVQLDFDKKALKYLQAICKREKKLANYSMLSIQKNSPQLNLFHGLADQLDQKHPLEFIQVRCL